MNQLKNFNNTPFVGNMGGESGGISITNDGNVIGDINGSPLIARSFYSRIEGQVGTSIELPSDFNPALLVTVNCLFKLDNGDVFFIGDAISGYQYPTAQLLYDRTNNRFNIYHSLAQEVDVTIIVTYISNT